MAAKITNPGTKTSDAPREHQGYRLNSALLAIVEDIALGLEAGDAGLKSCAMGALNSAAAGASAAEVNATHHRELAIIEDEDECFNAIGELKFRGFSFGEIAGMVVLGGGGATHLLALERWADKVRLRCRDTGDVTEDEGPFFWRGSALHERRHRGHRAMAALRESREGIGHAAVLHIVYGHPDPMLLSASKFLRDLELAPAGDAPKLDPADRDVFNLAKCLLPMGELAPLARYTAAVEARRQEMVHIEAARRLRRVEGVIPLSDHRARVAAAERILSSTDALRDAIALPAPKREDESKAAYEGRFEQGKTERLQFLSVVRSDANRMLTDASLAFRDAWQCA